MKYEETVEESIMSETMEILLTGTDEILHAMLSMDTLELVVQEIILMFDGRNEVMELL